MICCRSTRISASNAARRRNRSRTIPIIILQRSNIPQKIIRSCVSRQLDGIYDRGTVVTDSVATGKKNEAAPSAKLLAAVTEKPMEIIEAENQKVVPVGAGIPKQNDPSTPCKALMLPPDVQPNRSGPESLAVRLRCKAGNCVGCTVPAVAHQRVSGMGITSTAPARRKPSSFGSSLNRFANKCLLSGGLPLLLAPTSGTKGMG
jgi:hypothetical protein